MLRQEQEPSAVYVSAPPEPVMEVTELDGAVDRAVRRALAPFAGSIAEEEMVIRKAEMRGAAMPVALAYMDLGSSPEHAAREAIAQIQTAKSEAHARATAVRSRIGLFRGEGTGAATGLALGIFGVAVAAVATTVSSPIWSNENPVHYKIVSTRLKLPPSFCWWR